jgi:hypothetical protein
LSFLKIYSIENSLYLKECVKMQKIFRALALMLVVTLALLPFVGCGGDDDDDDAGGVAAVTGTVPATGGEIAANGALIINFDTGKNIDGGAVTVNGTPAALAGNQATWNAAGLTPGGSATLAIAWKNTDGTDGAASVTLTVTAPPSIFFPVSKLMMSAPFAAISPPVAGTVPVTAATPPASSSSSSPPQPTKGKRAKVTTNIKARALNIFCIFTHSFK